MAADVVLDADSFNPCCAELKKKFSKVKNERNVLKQGLKAIEIRIDNLVKENLQLKKAYVEEQLHAKLENEEKVKESSIRQKLEREIHDLKAEISSYKKNECLLKVNEDENQLLKARNLEGQNEIKRLKELLEKEKKKSDSEMKKAESEKKKSVEAWKLVKMEKNKAEEERKLVEIARKKAEEYSLCLEKAKSEAKEVREKLNAELSKADNAKKRVEAEKEKTNIEKTRADSQAIKAVEQKRLMEVEKKRANDEKVRADRLSQILEEEKQRREQLQKKLQETVSTPKGRCGSCNREERHSGDVNIMSANLKLLREQLKLEKKQAKYAKRMAKLEKAEKSYIMQELSILKHSFMQILSRFKMLDDRLSHSIEGIDAVAKIGKSSEIHGLKLENNVLGSKRGNHYSRIDLGLTETCCTGSFDFTEPTRECVGLPLPRGSCTRPTTGIISELESPIGGSDRNKSQSSAICSNTSCSDKRSMGSQERGSFAVTASAKLKKKHPNKRPTVMKLPSEVAKTRKNMELGFMASNAGKSYGPREVRNACLTASRHDTVDEGEFDRRSNRRKVQDPMEPVARVYAENNQSHLVIGEKLSAFKDILNIEGGVSALNSPEGCGVSQQFHNGIACFSEDHNQSCRQNYSNRSNTMASKQQTPVLQALGANDNRKLCDKFDSPRSRDPRPSFVAETIASSHQVRGNICIEQEGNAISKERADLISFENMIHGSCLKLLDLDNDADEKKYKMAVEMPLSPTLPDFELPNHQLCVEDDAQCVMERDKSMPFHSVGIMVREIGASNDAWDLLSHEGQDSLFPTKDPGKTCVLQNCASVHGRLNDDENNPSLSGIDGSLEVERGAPDGTINSSSGNKVPSAKIRKCTKGGKNIFNAEIAKRGSTHQLSEASRQTALSIGCNAEDSSKANPDTEVGKTPVYCVVFSNICEKESISRILYKRNTFSCQSYMISQIDHVVVQVHNALAMNTVLLPEEKGGVFFSLLLCNISNRMSANFNRTMSEYLLPSFESFADEINKVLSDAETKSLFEQICRLDVLAGLIEDFLIERKVLMCIDIYECSDTSSNLFQLDGAYVFSRAATIDQFVAGCIILASISAAADRIGFLLEASYRILRMCRNDLSWVLLALHIFASVCGNEFFNINEHSFLTIALRSVVLLLERGYQSGSSISSSLHSVFCAEPRFPPCNECPFAMGAVCMDKLINLLLDALQCYISKGVGYPNVNDSVNFSVCMIPACTETDEESRNSESELDGRTNAFHASCCLFTFRKHAANFPDCFPERAFCHFNDVVSLVELVGCYMSWEWTYDKIIPRLLKMLDSCKNEEFSTALFVLIGQLGRIGIDVGGHKGIAELRCSMTVFLDMSIAKKMSFPTQLAAIGALLNLLPLSFKDIVGEYDELTLDTSQSGHAKLIKKWFSNLSKQQQSVSEFFFGQANFHKK